MGTALSVTGNCIAATLLFVGDVVTSTVTFVIRLLVDGVDCVCGSGKNTSRHKVAWHAQRCSNEPVYHAEGKGAEGELDVEAMLARSAFPFKPEALLSKAREVLDSEFGTAASCDGSILAEDFQFVAPVVGPLSKKEFLGAFGSFKVKDGVPDLGKKFWLQVDPMEPNRVWFLSRASGVHTGQLAFYAPTGKEIKYPPQASSMLFDEQGKCYTLTVGYCMDKRIGNTEGLGAMFGLLVGIGKPLPFPEAKRLYTPSLRYEAFEHVSKMVEDLGFGPSAPKKEVSAPKEVPANGAPGSETELLGT